MNEQWNQINNVLIPLRSTFLVHLMLELLAHSLIVGFLEYFWDTKN